MLAALIVNGLVVAMAILLLFPQSAASSQLRRVVVEPLARFLLDMTWTKAGRIVLLTPVLALLLLMGPEMIALLAMLGGDFAAVELLLAIWAASVSGGLATAWRRTARAIHAIANGSQRLWRQLPIRPGPRGRRRKPERKPPRDEEGPDWALA